MSAVLFLLHFFGTFFVFSCGRKSSSADFGNAAYDYEAFWVNAVCKTFNFCNFAVGNDGHNNFGFVMFITGFGMKKGYAAIDFVKNLILDFVCFSCNDFNFGSGFSKNKGFIEEESINKGENDSVKDKVYGFEHCKKNNYNKI